MERILEAGQFKAKQLPYPASGEGSLPCSQTAILYRHKGSLGSGQGGQSAQEESAERAERYNQVEYKTTEGKNHHMV